MFTISPMFFWILLIISRNQCLLYHRHQIHLWRLNLYLENPTTLPASAYYIIERPLKRRCFYESTIWHFCNFPWISDRCDMAVASSIGVHYWYFWIYRSWCSWYYSKHHNCVNWLPSFCFVWIMPIQESVASLFWEKIKLEANGLL